MEHRNKRRFRLILLGILTLAGFCAIAAAAAGLYAPADIRSVTAETETLVRTQRIPASRGEIYDRNGTPLVSNRAVYTLEIDYANFDKDRRCTLIHQALALLSAHGIGYEDTMPVSAAPFCYTFPDESQTQQRKMENFLKYRGLDPTLSAEDAVTALCASYELPARFSPDEARAILGVFYELYQNDFSANTPYVLARGVDMELIAQVTENRELYRGLQIGMEYERVYDTAYCAHILGRVGAIPAEQLEDYIGDGYAYNARVGLDGAERAFEGYLRGNDGERTLETDLQGNALRLIKQTDADSGGNIYLTIDLDLQAAAEDSLARRIAGLRSDGGEAAGGAAAVLDVRTGEVLALASYPSYSLADFSQQYSSLLADPLKPMFNRALSGTYAPGSTFKMLTATAALNDGIIEPDTILECNGIYDYYAPDYLYRCWIYNDTGKTHGPLCVQDALAGSCNCFFYEVGRLCGIDRIANYARLFCLGEYTGIELGGEAQGVAASREEREAQGRSFYPGDTLQAAIGQSDNLFTPLQLASYVATLANGGTRYTPHILSKVLSADDSTLLFEKNAEIAEQIEYSEENLDAILSGMLSVTADGTASHVFEEYPVSVLGKSGSAQVADGTANAIFVLAAPAQAPRIAIAVVIEHGATGNNAALVARDILDAYFPDKNSKD